MANFRSDHPLGIIILATLELGNAIWNGLRLCEAIFFWTVLEKYHASPLYLALTGAFWFVVASILAIGLWGKKKWAWAGTLIGISCYGGWYWLDRLTVELPHANWPFALGFSILLLGISLLILFSGKTRAYFNLVK
jgi:hypothetical protein